ncbi:MAG: ATP-grasp domain-containing protein [Acidiferrobacteraceae bacterium]
MEPAAPAAAAATDPADARPARVLILAPHGSYRLAPFSAAARTLGFGVVIASESRFALGMPDAEAVRVDFTDPKSAIDRFVAMHRTSPFSAVIGTDDGSTELAALVCASLHLPHNPPEAVRVSRRKDLARARLLAHGVRVPWHRVLDRRRDLRLQMEGVIFPVVVKPVALSASRGVIRANDQSELSFAIERIGSILSEVDDPDEASLLLIERFVPGTEVAVEGLLDNARLRALSIFDKPEPLNGPYFEETYYITPSTLNMALQEEILRTVQGACDAYGLREGPVHAECRINDDGVWILEVAARTIGGLCARLLQFGVGFTLEELVLRHATRRPFELRDPEGASGVLMIPIAQGGILKRVEGVLAAERVPCIIDVHIDVREGYELIPLPEGASYLGFVFAKAKTPDKVLQASPGTRLSERCGTATLES